MVHYATSLSSQHAVPSAPHSMSELSALHATAHANETRVQQTLTEATEELRRCRDQLQTAVEGKDELERQIGDAMYAKSQVYHAHNGDELCASAVSSLQTELTQVTLTLSNTKEATLARQAHLVNMTAAIDDA
uniref:Uncharacterized protein n=1 Tax=Lygus hesperus TaxID=30085 RepID=A0A146KM60_LYGHE